MRREVMMEMSLSQLDEYARVCGIDTSGELTKEGKVALIEERRGRVAEIRMLGTVVTIPKSRLHDKRLADLVAGHRLSDEEVAQAFRDLLGEEQYAMVIDRCTDEDGTVDGDAYAVAFARVMTDPELKNF